MEMKDLYDHLSSKAASGELVRFRLRLFPPNGKSVVPLASTSQLFMGELPIDPDDNQPVEKVPVRPDPHQIQNYYYLRKLGEPDWQLIGQSDDWLRMWEIAYDAAKLPGPGTYVVKAMMVGEVGGKTIYGEDVVFFEAV